jgi:hypothetical protein
VKVPDDADNFIDSVFVTGAQMIERGFWEIQRSRLDSWLNQFCGREERFFAACLLDQTIVRSRPQFESCLRSLFRSNLNNAIFKDDHDLRLTEALMSRQDPKIRLVPVICESDPPTKSGPLVMRRLQRILKLNARWMCWPWQAKTAVVDCGVNTVIFVDDFLGSGDQFVKFFNQWGFNEVGTSAISLIYAPVVAHQFGLNNLTTSLSQVGVECVETLGTSHSFFNEGTWQLFSQGQISGSEARNWYLDFGKKRGVKPSSVNLLGYGELELVFGFSHSTPNSSLPILWHTSAEWQPLLER